MSGKGTENMKVSESLTWSDQNWPIKSMYYGISFFIIYIVYHLEWFTLFQSNKKVKAHLLVKWLPFLIINWETATNFATFSETLIYFVLGTILVLS